MTSRRSGEFAAGPGKLIVWAGLTGSIRGVEARKLQESRSELGCRGRVAEMAMDDACGAAFAG